MDIAGQKCVLLGGHADRGAGGAPSILPIRTKADRVRCSGPSVRANVFFGTVRSPWVIRHGFSPLLALASHILPVAPEQEPRGTHDTEGKFLPHVAG